MAAGYLVRANAWGGAWGYAWWGAWGNAWGVLEVVLILPPRVFTSGSAASAPRRAEDRTRPRKPLREEEESLFLAGIL